ncbi:hypothetical protein Pfo_009069 [Paulownia fortunei]|nr:hypothetical protein Pfo_009069 [Paulownia fortunei]
MEPCISEYGLMVVDNQDQQSIIANSILQAAQEDYNSLFKADTYAFGVILLELLTGRTVLNDGLDLASWVLAVVREEWTVEVFDKNLIREGASEERMVNVLQVAIRCVKKSPEARPSMKEVALAIRAIREDDERSMDVSELSMTRNLEASSSDALQRQLQQLFHLHDSGLDQAFIDALPVFSYKEVVGPKEPFDCAVCLCEFSETDQLRLLPMCSHAFHINCIDTWLLSNSTCPLCRGALFNPGFSIENPIFDYDDFREEDGCPNYGENGFSIAQKRVEIEEVAIEKGVGGETSSSKLDARRCFSMGSYQYVVGDANLRVALSQDGAGRDAKLINGTEQSCNASADGSTEGKKICIGTKTDSYSVSKIWLWSKKGKFASSSDAQLGNPSSPNLDLPWMHRTEGI